MNESVPDEYDSPWKKAVERYFPEFMAFYFPDAAKLIDWTQAYTFLDQELRAVVRDATLGKRFVDKLVQVTLLEGAEQWVYIHVEVQGAKQARFAKRMFTYNYRIFDRYDRPVASLAVLADEHPGWKPDRFGYSILGSETSIRFPVAKITDYHDRLEALLTQHNPFAIVTAAHILTQQTRGDDSYRFQAKWRLIRLLYERGWDKQRVIDLFQVIDWMMRLPKDLERELWHNINELEECGKMQYISSVERIGIEKGMEKGMEKGREKGKLEAEQNTLRRQISRRFKTSPAWVDERIAQAGQSELEQWLDNIIDAPTIEAVFESDNSTH
ncbi:cytosolic protein [Methylotuvimicrobium sp. KM2]|uniref:cytosolic protein n=1 Tax=Methylotuvimicrobium sp. KM2 TaxID=3133976 RepID=UPI003101AF78